MGDRHFVIDTNVLVSAFVFMSNNPIKAITSALLLGKVSVSTAVREEYVNTLENKFSRVW